MNMNVATLDHVLRALGCAHNIVDVEDAYPHLDDETRTDPAAEAVTEACAFWRACIARGGSL